MKLHVLIRRIFCIVIPFLLLLSIPGIYANWGYTNHDSIEEVYQEINLEYFPWTGFNILPEDGDVGENHRMLIDAIVNDPTIGLNNSSSQLNSDIDDRWSTGFLDPRRYTVGSMSPTFGGSLNDLFEAETSGLEFLLEFVDENNDGTIDYYYLYTTNINLTFGDHSAWWNTPTIPVGKNIYPIYRTTIVKNSYDQWIASETKMGYAPSAWYDATTAFGGLTQIPSFGYGSDWKEVTDSDSFGDNFSNAIWIHKDYQCTVSTATADTKVYYAISPVESGTYTATAEQQHCAFTIYDANQTQIAASDGYGPVSWEATQNTVYYIVISGEKQMSFVVTQ